MIRCLEGFDPYATAQLPASERWTTASGVTIEANGGRSGIAGDNAARFSTDLASILSGPLACTAVSGVEQATWGHGVLVEALTGQVTLGSLATTISRFDLVLDDDGALLVRQTAGGVLLGTICTTADGAVPLVTGGTYIEMRVRLVSGVRSAVQIRVRDQWGAMNPLVQGALLALVAGESFTTRTIGGGIDDDDCDWLVDDVYYTDGVAAATPVVYEGLLVYNDGYLGDVHVEAFYSTQDGLNLSTGNTPWVPSSGAEQYPMIDEHPPDEDTTYLEADTAEQTTTVAYESDRGSGFGRVGCTATSAPIYGLLLTGRMRTDADPVDVVPIVRTVVGGTLATDTVYEGDPISVDDTDYVYYPTYLDRNPNDSDAPWTFAIFSPVGGVGDVEFGMRVA